MRAKTKTAETIPHRKYHIYIEEREIQRRGRGRKWHREERNARHHIETHRYI